MDQNVCKIGLVSYLSACPLGHGLSENSRFEVKLHPPSWLAEMLEDEIVDIALVPVFDYLKHKDEWEICVPYGICSEKQVWTVRIFSPVKLNRIDELIVDNDSHTSIALSEILIHRMTGQKPELVHRNFTELPGSICEPTLLIGDKAWQMKEAKYIYDLGELWHSQFNLPFVYAVWCCRKNQISQEVKDLPIDTAEKNLLKIDELAQIYGPPHGFSVDDAYTYFHKIIHYRIRLPELSAINLFEDYVRCRE